MTAEKSAWARFLSSCSFGDQTTTHDPISNKRKKKKKKKKKKSQTTSSSSASSSPKAKKQHVMTMTKQGSLSSNLHAFTMGELTVITHRFSSSNFLGEGRLGPVHKGFIHDMLRPGRCRQARRRRRPPGPPRVVDGNDISGSTEAPAFGEADWLLLRRG